MPWIEGIGDEVTITVSIFLGVVIILAAWISTGIRDIPFISVIIVQLTRRPRRQESDSGGQDSGATNSSSSTSGLGREEGGSFDPLITHGEDIPSIRDLFNDSDDEDDETDVESGENVADNGEGTFGHQESKIKEKSENSNGKLKNSENNVCHPSGNSVQSDSSEQTVGVEDLKPSELRQRRLQFFSGESRTEFSNECANVASTSEVGSSVENKEVNSANEQTDNKEKSLGSQTKNDVDVPICAENDIEPEPLPENVESLSNSENSPEGTPDEIRVRIKFLNDTQRLVTSPPNETIGNFRRRHFETELSQSKLVRFIFNGQDLRNDASTLQSYNISDNSVLHCLVTQQPQARAARNIDGDSFDIGVLMFPLFGLLLGIVWYMRIMYRQFFNVTSTLTLGGITFLFVAAFMSSLRGQRAHEHVD